MHTGEKKKITQQQVFLVFLSVLCFFSLLKEKA